MAYYLSITRADALTQSDPHPITEAEWRAVVDADDSLRVSDRWYYDRPEDDGRTTRVYGVEWLGHPVARAEHPCFWWYDDGRIWKKLPDTTTVQKMMDLAVLLHAKVLGDGGELYEEQIDLSDLEALNAEYEETMAPSVAKRKNFDTSRAHWWKWRTWFRR